MEHRSQPQVVLAVGPNGMERDQLVKSNILYIDGRNLHRSRMLDYHPLGKNAGRKLHVGDDHSAGDNNNSLLSRYVQEILTLLCRSDSRYYARRLGGSLEDYRDYLRDYFKEPTAAKLHQSPYPIEQTVWHVVKRQYRFQIDNLYNQLEDVCVSILNLSLVEVPAGSPFIGPDVLLASLDEYHSRLFANYYKWCDYLGTVPFPWRNPPWLEDSYCTEDKPSVEAEHPSKIWSAQTRQELQQMMFEVATFKLLWAEAANLRHTPELLCWLFHWMCMAWDKDFRAEEDFTDLIRDVIQRIRDEQWYLAAALRTPDHNARLLYDDFNELFWDRRCIDILHKFQVDAAVQEQDAANGAQLTHSSTQEGSSRDPQPVKSMDFRLSLKNSSQIGLLVSRENLNAVVAELSCSSKPGSGVKTFIERRTYAQRVPFYVQVLRNFWRVFAWHVTTFAGILMLYSLLNEESSFSVRKQWAAMTVAATLSYGMLPVFDVLLLNYRAMAKPHFWSFAWKRALIHVARLSFAIAALLTVAFKGLESVHLQWNGLLSLLYWSFFICHWGHYFLYVRIRDRMPFFIMLWSNKWLALLSKPSTFTGNVPLLAENITHVLRYSLFWLFAMTAKTLYWLYIILPPTVAASKHVDYVSCRPVYISSAVLWPGYLPVMLQGFIWIPAFLIWLFDMQIFFLLFGALYGSVDGYVRRVGYITNCRKIQQRLLPMLPLSAIFREPPGGMINRDTMPLTNPPSRLPQHHRTLTQQYTRFTDNYCHRGTFSRLATAGLNKQQVYGHSPSFALPSGAHESRRPAAQYANTSDPYINMVPLTRTKTLVQSEADGQRCREETDNLLAIKRFGFLWNEIIESWRNEDIICHSEQEKLEFNELPHILYEYNNVADLYLECERAVIDWRHSTVRHPVFVYCNELTAFLKACEDFHYQVSGGMLRLCSKQALARTFYRKYLSSDPNAKDPRFEKSMHLHACQEVAEALTLYLARYFSEGPQLVHAIKDLWSWIDSDAQRLLWLNLRGLKALGKALQSIFCLVQKASFWMPNDGEALKKANAELRKALLAMIMLPSSKPEELGGSNIPLVVQDFIKSVTVCFGSHSVITEMPSILPAPLRRAEVAVMLEQLEVTLQHTSLLLLSSEEEQTPPCAEGPPLLPEELAEMRALHTQLGEADASVVLGDNGFQDSKFLIRGTKDPATIASTEHALKLFFRRAAKILKAEDPSFKCSETQRRFGTFINSLLMKIPETPLVRNMVSMMTLTPYYREDTRLDLQELEKRTDEGVCKMDLLRSLHPVEFDNFIERVDRDRDMFTIRQEIEDRVTDSPERRKLALQDIRAQMQQSGLLHRYDRFCEMLQEWASYRGQVLMRTVYGIMYYEQAVRMQAYLEETAPEDLHLCRDLNRLDETQLEIIRSPEGALWREVVGFAPPYETKQSTRELAQLKYQYIVAAQEFGTDLSAEMPSNGCEPSPFLRAQLLRKVALYKLLVRYPSLRVATLEHERSPDGRPTGHKLSVLYRLTADIDPVGERIATPAAANVKQLRAAGRFARPVDQETKPAPIPALLVPAPRIPICTPGANMEASSVVAIKPRSGGSSSGGFQSAGACSKVSSNASTTPIGVHETAASPEAICSNGNDGQALHERENTLHEERILSLRLSIVEGTRQLLGQSFKESGGNTKIFNDSQQSEASLQASPEGHSDSQLFPPQQVPNTGGSGGSSNATAGDFESKLARAIHWLHQKKQVDRYLFATRTRRVFRRTVAPQEDAERSPVQVSDEKNDSRSPRNMVASGSEETLISLLCQGLPHGLVEDAVAQGPSVDASPLKTNKSVKKQRFATPQSGSFAAACPSGNICMDEPQPAQVRPAAVHSTSPRFPLLQAKTTHRSFAEEIKDYETPSARAEDQNHSEALLINLRQRKDAHGPPSNVIGNLPVSCTRKPTLLEAQFARDLARDFIRPQASGVSGGLPTTTALSHECCPVAHKEARSRGSEVTWSVPHGSIQETQQAAREQSVVSSSQEMQYALRPLGSRRHSIITLHPRQSGTLVWNSLLTMNCEDWEYSAGSPSRHDDRQVSLVNASAILNEKASLEQVEGCPHFNVQGAVVLRQEPNHRTECQASPTAANANLRTAGSLAGPDRQVFGGLGEKNDDNKTQTKLSGSAFRRSNSVEAFKKQGFLSMKERVAFFEDRLSRHQARMEAEAYSLARQHRTTQRQGMLWPSQRGPLRLEAIYKIRLPLLMDDSGTPWGRAPIIGPGKPENQNHAIAFSRMDTMQVMDMNMESYLEEAIKLRNLLQEFVLNARMRILGFREHIFTENVSSLASYMALQENLFTTTNQRLYFTPLRVRMHYGHPDIFDRYFVQTCGSCSKASNGINLSEDIFAGFNCTARGYCVHHADYIQCGKGRDVGLQQVVMFEKKVAGGNGEQMLSRDLNRLVLNMDFFRLLSLWFTGPGFFLNSVILVLAAYVCLYTKCFLAFAKHNYSGPVESALEYVLTPSTYVQFQLGMLLVLPLIPWLFLEKGFGAALRKLIDLISKFSVTYYNFMTCTKASVIDHVLIYGGAKYQETGRGFVIERATLKDIWMFFYFTHFSIGSEMFVLLAIYAMYAGLDVGVFFLDTWPILLMATSINAVPFLFNPLGFYYPRLRQDFTNWNSWMTSREMGLPKDSWLSWWRGEMEQRCNIVWHHKVIIMLRLLRFPLLAAGIISCVATSIQSADVDCAIYLVAASGLFVTIKPFLGDLQIVSPSAKAWLTLVLLAAATTLLFWLVCMNKMSLGSLVVSLFAICLFIYGALEISFALLDRWAVRSDMLSDVVRIYHRCAGFCTFAPLLVLSALTTSVHHLQTRILFNPTFVSIVKSGLVQREQVEKSGHGHS